MASLSGTSCVVTGGASGLGLATAHRLSEQGALVTVADVDVEGGRAAAARVEGAEFIRTDVTDGAQVDVAMASAAARAPLFTVVACAGIGQYRRIIHPRRGLATEDFAALVQVNLVGTAATLLSAARTMVANEPRAGDRGVIVLTSSIAAHGGGVGSLAYCAAKAGVSGLTLPAAHDLAEHGIRVVGIEPGFFDTPLLADQHDSFRALVATVPHPRRLGEAAEFGRLVASIVDIPMLNGTNIRLDAAWRASFVPPTSGGRVEREPSHAG